MIKKLTDKQVDKFQEYVDKYVKIGLCTDRVDFDRAKKFSDYYYQRILEKKSVPVVVLRSPIETWMAVCIFQVSNHVKNQVENQVLGQVWSQVWNQVRGQVENQVGNQVESQVLSHVWSQVENHVWSQVENHVWGQVWSQVGNQVGNQVRGQVGNQVESQVENQAESQGFVWPYLNGSFWSSFFSFYDFMQNELGIKYKHLEKYEWLKLSLDIGLFYPLDNVCIISDRPSKILMNKSGLHCETGKALEYIDGWGFYSLNGIVVPDWVVKTDKDKITVKQLLSIENADARRECLRKMGVDRLINEGKELERNETYRLIDLGRFFSQNKDFYAPFLVMKNPSLEGVWHCEGVHEDCKTIYEALSWRNSNNKKVVELT